VDEMSASAQSVLRHVKMWARNNNRYITAAINGSVVALVFSGAFYKAVEVDLDIARGWTVSEFMLTTARDDFMMYQQAAINHPFFTKACTSGVAYCLGDFAAQTFQGRTVFTIDLPRTLRSGIAGFCIHGPLCHLWIQWMEANLSFDGAWYSTLAKVVADQTVWSIVLNTMYTSAILLMQGKSPQYISDEVKSTWWPAISSGWRFWPFVHTVSFSPFVPQELKLLFIDTMEIIWVTILASVVNRKEETPQLVCNIEPSTAASMPFASIEMTKDGQRQPYIEDNEGNVTPVVLHTADLEELVDMGVAERARSLEGSIDEWDVYHTPESAEEELEAEKEFVNQKASRVD